MAESLRCLPETITTLLIGYTPTQNKKLKEKKKVLALQSPHNPHLCRENKRFLILEPASLLSRDVGAHGEGGAFGSPPPQPIQHPHLESPACCLSYDHRLSAMCFYIFFLLTVKLICVYCGKFGKYTK